MSGNSTKPFHVERSLPKMIPNMKQKANLRYTGNDMAKVIITAALCTAVSVIVLILSING